MATEDETRKRGKGTDTVTQTRYSPVRQTQYLIFAHIIDSRLSPAAKLDEVVLMFEDLDRSVLLLDGLIPSLRQAPVSKTPDRSNAGRCLGLVC